VRHAVAILITVLIDEADPQTLRGRLRAIALDQYRPFTGVGELISALQSEVAASLASQAAGPGSPSGVDLPGDTITDSPS
jgi:hypothetical protein